MQNVVDFQQIWAKGNFTTEKKEKKNHTSLLYFAREVWLFLARWRESCWHKALISLHTQLITYKRANFLRFFLPQSQRCSCAKLFPGSFFRIWYVQISDHSTPALPTPPSFRSPHSLYCYRTQTPPPMNEVTLISVLIPSWYVVSGLSMAMNLWPLER